MPPKDPWPEHTAVAGNRRARQRRNRAKRRTVICTILLLVVAVAFAGVWWALGRGPSGGRPAASDTRRGAGTREQLAASEEPCTPSGLKAIQVAAKLRLTWSCAAHATERVNYLLYRNGKKIAATSRTWYVDTGARPGRTYTYEVAATDARGRTSRRSVPLTVVMRPARHGATQPPVPNPTGSTGTGVSSPAGFVGAADTGYVNSPGYPGHLTNCARLTVRSNRTYRYCDFSQGLEVGSANSHPANVTFIGCRFASNAVNDADVADYGSNITFQYDTFEPNTVPPSSEPTSPTAPAIALNMGYQYAIDQRFPGPLTVDHADIWGFEEGIQFLYSTESQPVSISNSWIHNPRNPGTTDHTDGLLESYGHLSYMTFYHNTIVGNGNTNALGLQGPDYSHITVEDNYFSGYGYTVNTGANTNSTHMTFVGNVWGTDIEPAFGPLYGNAMYTTPGLGSVWKDNTIYVAPGTTWMARRNSGKYWWPTDTNPSNAQQMVGHSTDYPGP